MKAAQLFNVKGLVTVVTGGASGIGYAYAQVMADNDAIVTIVDRDAAAIPPAVMKLKGSMAEAFGEVADVTDKASLTRALDAVAKRHGRIDVVFANAGISGGPGFLNTKNERDESRAIENLPDDLWDRVIATNLSSVFKTIQVAVPHLKRNGGGKIIVTSSCSATKIEHYVSTVYVTSKAGVAHLVRQTAVELARYNISINAIAPGPCITNIGGGRLHDAAAQEFFSSLHPNHRMAVPEDLQGAALYLASPASRHMTGGELLIDGGFTLGTVD